VPLLDVGPAKTYVPGKHEPFSDQTTYKDGGLPGQRPGRAPHHAVRRRRRGGTARPGQPVVDLQGIATTADYFAMFEAPLLHGAAWSAEDDAARHRGRPEPAQGRKTVRQGRIRSASACASGAATSPWSACSTTGASCRATPTWSTPAGGEFAGEEEVYIPFATAIALELPNNGSTDLHTTSGVGFQGLLASECIWLQFWFELKSAADGRRCSLVDGYAREQQRLGRLERKRRTACSTCAMAGPGWKWCATTAGRRLARLRLPAAVHGQHHGPAAGEVLGALGGGRRAARARRHPRGDLPPVPGGGRP
jgi:putative ABC transport system permease protein